MPATASLTAIM